MSIKLSPPLFCMLLLIWSCSPSPRYTVIKAREEKPSDRTGKTYEIDGKTYRIMGEKPPAGTKMQGITSYYADDFHGRKTSNGETYDMYGLTAAHKTLPINTWIEVTNLSDGRTVIVRINDRGPFIEGRILDLSYGAAKVLNMLDKGLQEVEIEILR